jgi:hypothetical protein
VANLTSEWKRLSAQYADAREQFEATSLVVAKRRETYSTPTDSELTANRSARTALRLATQRLYDFLARSKIADDRNT